MAEIIPAIIAENYKELEEKIKAVEGFCEWVQIDVMDGKFVLQKTFNHSAELALLKTPLKLEAHLMVEHPWHFVYDFAIVGVKRILVHYEAVSYRLDAENVFDEMLTKCHLTSCEFGIAINPETPIEVLEPYILKIDIVLVMGVKPGRAGQIFKENVLAKIKSLRRKYPGVKIEVDGGVNLDTASAILKSGADVLVAGSVIWQAEDKREIIDKLKNIKS